jgi:hypothetical protein
MTQPAASEQEVLAVKAEVLAMGAAYQAAVNELAEIGITHPSPFDVQSWQSASARDKRKLMREWLFVRALPEPAFKQKR